MTKAERRELQERQRAAKAANAGGAPAGAKPPKPQKPQQQQQQQQGQQSKPQSQQQQSSSAPSQQQKPAAKPGAKQAAAAKPAPVAPTAYAPAPDRGTRIFEHFGQPKHAGTLRSHIKNLGDIHPAILKLGLQFADFKMTGANARTLATLQALKIVSTVRCVLDLSKDAFAGHPRVQHAARCGSEPRPHPSSYASNHLPRLRTRHVRQYG